MGVHTIYKVSFRTYFAQILLSLPNICFLKQFSFHGTLHLGVRADTDNKQHNKQKIKCKTQF